MKLLGKFKVRTRLLVAFLTISMLMGIVGLTNIISLNKVNANAG